MASTKVSKRNYKGTCRSCKAPEMVQCSPECTYLDPWKDYYLGPTNKNRLDAQRLRLEDLKLELDHNAVLRIVSNG